MAKHMTKKRQQQKGVAAIEFAIIFVILFAIFYALVSYTFPLLLLQSFNNAAAQAARATLQADPSLNPANYQLQAQTLANAEITQQLSWLPDTIAGKLQHSTSLDSGRVVVVINYPNYNADPVVPKISLPGIGDIPRLPNELKAQASITP